METQDLKSKVRRIAEEGWNKRNITVLDEIYAPDAVYHHPLVQLTSRAALKAWYADNIAMYPDLHLTIDDIMAAEGDKVATRLTVEGTDTGGWAPTGVKPTGKHVKFTAILITRFAGGKIAEEWIELDLLARQKQQYG